MGQFFNSIKEVSKNYSKYDEWEQRQANERAQKEYLAKNLEIPQDKIELTKKKAETVVRATEIMDARSEDNCQNVEQVTGMLAIIPMLGIQLAQQPLMEYFKKYKNGSAYVSGGSVLAIMATAISMILWGNSKQKEASRIGRYQAKQNELKGLENFVLYTPEQIEKAQEIAKKIPDEKERNGLLKAIKELKDVAKDKKAYKKWFAEKDPQEIEKLKQLNFSPEQLMQAEEDKELIVDTVKEINIKAEEYSENVENAFDTMQSVSWLAAIPLGIGINKLLKAFNANKKLKTVISVIVPTFTALGISMTGTLEEKKASRVGRFKARQDILKNPTRLMAFSKEDMEKAKDIKASEQKKSFWSKIGENFKFLRTYYKDKSEYQKYKKTTQKENEKIQKALKEIEISDTQKSEAQALQKNLFRAFDEIDEMSQRYSEDVEAGTEIAKEIGGTIWALASMAGMALLGIKVAKGKFPIAKLGNWLTNRTFNSQSSIKKAINGFYEVLKTQDKQVIQDFQKSLVTGKIKYFLEKPGNEALKDAAEPVIMEFGKIGLKGLNNVRNFDGKAKDLTGVFSELFKEHFKQTVVAKWTRSMISQCLKLWVKRKASSADLAIPKDVQEKLGMNFTYKNYKTLINTGIVGSIPILGTILGIPYAFNAWLTNIQKKAGKIGIMKAMDKIDDPRVFANPESAPNPQEKAKNDDSNLINRIKQQVV